MMEMLCLAHGANYSTIRPTFLTAGFNEHPDQVRRGQVGLSGGVHLGVGRRKPRFTDTGSNLGEAKN
ncbi:hypothetical protein KM043_009944 [Ampulex compressa]|nr:hypothetical protein KM043_009944 [Ampulex compressa]